MNTRIVACLLALASPALAAPPSATLASAPASAPSNTLASAWAEEPTREAFMSKFRKAMEIQADGEMQKLVRTNQQHAVDTVILTCEAISAGSNDQLEKEIAALNKAWKATLKTSFVDKMYEYFSLLRPEYRDTRSTLKARYNKVNKRYNEALVAKDQNAFPGISLEFEGLGEAFAEVGDHYYASQCWLTYGICWDESLRGDDDADFNRAWKGYGEALKEREAVDLKDIRYNETKQRFDFLDAKGFGKPGEGGKMKQPGEAELGSASTTSTLTFESLKKVTDFARPSYWVDEVYASWNAVALRTKGTSAKFGAMEKGPLVMRTGASQVMVDQDGDGEGDIQIPLTGNIEPIEVEIGQGDEKRKWSFFTVTGNQRDTYQGIEMNLEPDDNQMSLYVMSAACMVGTIGETTVRVIDDNMDGVYGSEPRPWGYIGTTEGNFQQDIDSVVVGKEKKARPWSEFQKIDDQWYKLESKKAGTEIVATPATVEEGVLKLKFKGPSPQWLIVKGTKSYENSYFDLLQNGKKGVEVPIGRYELFCGFVSKGKRNQVMKAIVVPGKNTPTWKVEAGETTTVELGAPFGFDFQFVEGEDTVKVVGSSISVTGVSDERYQRLWNCTVKPEGSIRKAGSKKGSKFEKLRVASGQGDITDYGYIAAWFPMDTELGKPKLKPGDGLQVQLYEKKNKLFGKIESVWRD